MVAIKQMPNGGSGFIPYIPPALSNKIAGKSHINASVTAKAVEELAPPFSPSSTN